jgi:hypothetical protein
MGMRSYVKSKEAEIEKKAAWVAKVKDIISERDKEDKSLAEEWDNITAEHPGFSGSDPSL